MTSRSLLTSVLVPIEYSEPLGAWATCIGLVTQLKRIAAFKVLPDALDRNPQRMVRFQREAGLLASLDHRFKSLESVIFPET